MSCAQVMYQPYAASPYVVPPETPQALAPGPASTPGGDSRHTEGVLHLPPPVTPQTPPHAHHHHAHHQLQQQQQGGESSSSSGGQLQQQQQGAGDPTVGQRPLPRPPFRAASRGSAAADPDAPPPEKKFCSDAEAPAASQTPTHHQHPPHHHHQHQHHHHHHHHHQQHQHHHPPLTEPPASPSEQANQEVKYVSANCMVVTHYAGDAATVVDEHFSRALSTPHYDKPHSPGKASSPMSSRNFPPSFWNSNYQVPSSSSSSSSSRPPSLAGHLGASPADLYDPYHGGLHPLQPPAPDPWAAYSLSSQAYGHRSVAHDVYQAAMSSVPSTSRPYHQYSSLALQPHLARLPTVGTQMGMSKPEAWGARYHEAFTSPDFTHSLDANYSAPHYPNVPGLETGVPQEGAKDLYWF